MALIYPWVLLGVAVVGAIVLTTGWLIRRGVAPKTTGHYAFAQRLRELSNYRARARQLFRLGIAELCFVVLALAGSALLTARMVETVPSDEERASRDIILCLDVSGSMIAIDQKLLDVYSDLATRLAGERIGLVLFDSTAVTVFPLTDDADYVLTQLKMTRERIGAEPYPGTNLAEGSSLIGDGLATCVARFDHAQDHRSRTIVLATDNQLAGAPLYPLPAAVDLAAQQQVLLFAITPQNNPPQYTQQLRDQTRRTSGEVLLLDEQNLTDTTDIEQAVTAQERIALAARSRQLVRDRTWPGALIALTGLVGAVVCAAVRRPR